ncbi:helix-turn-helix domain-containing protein [Congzhengia sp.]|uniref:helix-turn-helix domain-containing protein n=1 Tax=Congzhengia sp. TaxID=2944168 RepID=UPI003077E902
MKLYTENFTIILNKHITNTDIDTYEFRVLCYLLMLSDDEGVCFPSYNTIAEKIGIGETKVKSAIKRLIELGIINKTNRTKEDGSAGSNLYVVCEKTTMQVAEKPDVVVESTTPRVPDDSPVGCEKPKGGVQDDHNKYINNNTKYFINNHLSSIEDVMDRAETYELSGELKKNFESAIEIMYNSKYIKVGGCEIPQDEVRNRLENISYEHIVYVCNNMPREVTPNGIALKVYKMVPYIVTALYNSLRYTAEEIKEIEYGDFYNST